MQFGTQPTPTAIKKLMGNPGKQKLNKSEAIPASTPLAQQPPYWLTGAARKVWKEEAPTLFVCGLLTNADRKQFAAYCRYYSDWQQYMQDIEKEGSFILINNDQTRIPNPKYKLAAEAFKAWLPLSDRFGMTPAARSKISLPEAPQESKLDTFLKMAQ